MICTPSPLPSPPCSTFAIHGPCIEKPGKTWTSLTSQAPIFNIKWQNRHTNNEVLNRSEMPSIEAAILKHSLRWSGHITRMAPSILSRIILYSELVNGQHRRASKLSYKEQVKTSLQVEISPNTWETETANHPSGRRAILFVCSSFEESRKTEKEVEKKNARPGKSS